MLYYLNTDRQALIEQTVLELPAQIQRYTFIYAVIMNKFAVWERKRIAHVADLPPLNFSLVIFVVQDRKESHSKTKHNNLINIIILFYFRSIVFLVC